MEKFNCFNMFQDRRKLPLGTNIPMTSNRFREMNSLNAFALCYSLQIMVERGRVVDCSLSLLKAGCSHPAEGVDGNDSIVDQRSFLNELMGSDIVTHFKRLMSLTQQPEKGPEVASQQDTRSLPSHIG
jgi:hypothetical protein